MWLCLCVLLSGCGEPGEVAAGEETYNRYCFSCHAAGLAGAPKTGIADMWAPRLAKGREVLLATTIEGIAPGMPPRGLCQECTDAQLNDAIGFMLSAKP
ncbi:MAG: c-type cytochrome [Proteobacteria bacterium]|nr:c-type cytochrome [Pseudomonadota bacterium]